MAATLSAFANMGLGNSLNRLVAVGYQNNTTTQNLAAPGDLPLTFKFAANGAMSTAQVIPGGITGTVTNLIAQIFTNSATGSGNPAAVGIYSQPAAAADFTVAFTLRMRTDFTIPTTNAGFQSSTPATLGINGLPVTFSAGDRITFAIATRDVAALSAMHAIMILA